jgi:AraC-like DNA-binding protein
MSMTSFSSENRNGMSPPQLDPRRPREEAIYPRQEDQHRLQLSTHALPERDRFEVFRENFRQYLFQVDVANRAEGIFDGNIELLKAGSVSVSRIVAPPSLYARTRRHLSDSEDAYTLFVGRTDGPTNEQAGVSHKFQPGNGFLYNGSMPGGCEAAAPFEVWGIKVPAGRLKNGLAQGRDLKAIGIPAELPAMQLIVQYLNSFATVSSSPDPDVREAFGTHLVDLLMLIVGADRDCLELIKGRGLKAARTAAVLKMIERDFASPALSADRVGLSLGITGRQVHRLLEETTKTFYEHVLERRLIEALQLLTSPTCAALKVVDIARRAGFADPSYFHRAFRTRFGDTPTGVRAAAARAKTARFLRA